MAYGTSPTPGRSRASLLYSRDGLVDIFVGLTIMLFAGFLVAGVPWMIAIWAAVLTPLWQSSKKALTAPRLRETDLLPAQAERRMTQGLTIAIGAGVAVLLALGVGLLLLLVSGGAPSWLLQGIRAYMTLGFGGFIAVALALIGWLSGEWRFYAYAAVTALIFLVGYLLQADLLALIALAGLLVTATGALILLRFLQSHPAHRSA